MSMLAFFPWYKSIEKYEFEDFTLISSNHESLINNSDYQKIFSNVFKPYIINKKGPINSAMLLFLKDKLPFEDFADTERMYLFSLSEIIAFSNIIERKLFISIGPYCNRDDFQLVIQSFDSAHKGMSIYSRRRDGNKHSIYSGDNYQCLVDPHLNYNSAKPLNENIIKSLLNAQNTLNDKWALYSDTIFNFNHANSDNNNISPKEEAIMLLGAIQRILGCNSANIDELSSGLKDALTPESNLDLNLSNRYKHGPTNKDNPTCLREIWIKDFYRARGDFAHGKGKTFKELTWTLNEHLLYASYILPLLLKLKLSEDNLYTMTELDLVDVDLFEEYLDIHPFNIIDEETQECEGSKMAEKRILKQFTKRALRELNINE